jgi:hypothetical protein
MVLPAHHGPSRGIRLVDWEFARLGMPEWDVGSMFANYLAWWVASLSSLAPDELHEAPPPARFPLERMHPAVQGFWDAYRGSTVPTHCSAGEFLLRSCRCAGARLVQFAYEQSQRAPDVTQHVVALLQVSENILDRPLEALVHLLGIEAPEVP